MERSGQAIDAGMIMGQLETGGARRSRRRAAALIGWHEPDESRGSSPEFCEGLGVKFLGPTRRTKPGGRVRLAQSNGRKNGLSFSGDPMYPALDKEIATFERRTPKSAEAHKKNLKRIPLGVASNYRAYDPYPIFVKEGQGSHFRDLDGNDYIDHNLCFGALMAGHCHPAVMKAVAERLAPRHHVWHAARHGVATGRRNLPTLSRSKWCASATAERKPRCTLFAWLVPRLVATRS